MELLNDPTMRKILIGELIKKKEFMSDPSSVIVNELDVFGAAIIDVAVINGKMHGFEIKSERDNLDRLPSQMDAYNNTFDTVTLVLTKNHLEKATAMIPSWWGILCVLRTSKGYSVKKIRAAKKNKNINPFNITQLLWREELIELLQKSSYPRGLKSKSRMELGQLVSNLVTSQEISDFVRLKLKSREGWKAQTVQQLCGDLQQL